MASFSNADHLDDALRAYSQPNDERLGEIVRSAVTHLYAFVEEVGLTRDEWFRGIEFLTAVGQMCDERRQEFILLSDTLGVSMLVEMVDQHAAEGTTEPTVFGPFHVDGAPRREMGTSIVDDDDPGEPLTIGGFVRDLEGNPVAGATIDVWQTASNGKYDVQDPDQPPMNLRGMFTTGADGRYEFRTVRPVAYPIPDDGPVGAMLQAAGRHNWRPAHTHMVIDATGYKRIITHLFDRDSPYLDSDTVFGVRDSLVVDMSGGTATFDIVLESSD
jgi:catechol 1,2-dioxygenase